MIKSINIAVTNKCNLKCIMCDIWKEEPKIDASLDIVKRIFQSKCLDKEVDISLTGGEPFLYKNLSGLTKLILKKKADSLKTVTTNGVLTKKILNYLEEFRSSLPEGFSLNISLDGININDAQRGKSLDNILKTITLVKEKFPLVDIKIKFTITPVNYFDLIPTYNFCKENDLDFRIKLVEYAENYTNRIEKRKFKFDFETRKRIAKDLSRMYKEKIKYDKTDSKFVSNTFNFLLGKMPPLSCKTPFERIFIMPNKDIYSCIHFPKIGNLDESSLDEIWNSEKAEAIRKEINENKCNKCVSYHGWV